MPVFDLRMKIDDRQVSQIERGLQSLVRSSKGEEHEFLQKTIKEFKQAVYESKRRMEEDGPYLERGYLNRESYLKAQAEDYGIPYSTVQELAEEYGPEGDFDELLEELERIADEF